MSGALFEHIFVMSSACRCSWLPVDATTQGTHVGRHRARQPCRAASSFPGQSLIAPPYAYDSVVLHTNLQLTREGLRSAGGAPGKQYRWAQQGEMAGGWGVRSNQERFRSNQQRFESNRASNGTEQEYTRGLCTAQMNALGRHVAKNTAESSKHGAKSGGGEVILAVGVDRGGFLVGWGGVG